LKPPLVVRFLKITKINQLTVADACDCRLT
jgi:hypothetical protein